MTIEQLREQLNNLKANENTIKKQRLEVEKQIIDLVHDELKEQGTTNIHGLKIVTGYTRKWDQAMLQEMVEKGIPPKLFPFHVEYKEEKKKSDYLANNEPEIWEYIAKALTLTPRKPSISIIEEQKEAA